MAETRFGEFEDRVQQFRTLVQDNNEAVASGIACPVQMKDEILAEWQPTIELLQQTKGSDIGVDIFIADPLRRDVTIEFNTKEPKSGEIPARVDAGLHTRAQAGEVGASQRLQFVRQQLVRETGSDRPYFANKLDRYDYDLAQMNTAAQKPPKSPYGAMRAKQSRKMRFYSA